MTDRDALRDRLDAVEEDLGERAGWGPMFAFDDGDGYVTPDGDPVPTVDGEPAPERRGPLFVLPPEVTDNWDRPVDDARGGT